MRSPDLVTSTYAIHPSLRALSVATRQAKLMNCALVTGADGSAPLGNWEATSCRPLFRSAITDAIQRARHTHHDVVAVSFNEDVFAHVDRIYTSDMTKVFLVSVVVRTRRRITT